MPCFKPLQGFLSHSGKGISFNPKTGYVDRPMVVPCGQCIGCKLERSRQWAVRAVHESKLHHLNCFVTLTYSDDKIPPGGTLVKKHLQDFWKRLRKKYTGLKIRYLACGEYGDNTHRPHYHAIIFGLDFPDKRIISSKGGNDLYSSPTLESLWGHGFCTIGAVTFDTAAYVARYTTKKITGDQAERHYRGRLPEFLSCSLRPGIGAAFFERFAPEITLHDTVVSRAVEAKPPIYYDKLHKRVNPARALQTKRERKLNALEPARQANSTPDRLRVREEVTKAKLSIKSRTL